MSTSATHQNLDREPSVAHTLDVEEKQVRICLLLVDEPARCVILCCNSDIVDYH